MDNKGLIVVSSWIGTITLLVVGAIFDLDFIGMFIFVVIIFALSGIAFAVFEDDSAQEEMAEVENDISQLRHEVKSLHAKIDDIKRLFEE